MHRYLILLAVVAVTTACTHGLAPTRDDLINEPVEVVAPVLDEKVGKLALTRDGRWAFQTGEDAAAPDWERGQVVGFGGVDERRRHVFVVLSVEGWGAYLQRLDAGPIATGRSASLIPIGHTSPQVLRRWNICAGQGNPAEHDCLTGAEAGTRWDIFAADGARVKLAAESSGVLLPATRAAHVHMSSLGNDVLGDAPDGWYAVPRSTEFRPPHAIVGLDPSCRGRELPADTLIATPVVEFPKATGLLQTEVAAWNAGVDAFAKCSEGAVHLAIPGLARRGWRRLDGNYTGPFLSGFIVLDAPAKAFEQAVHFAGLLGAGDLPAADFFAESVLRVSGSDAEDFARDTAQSAVEAGRIEGALRQGAEGTSSQWNRENDPRWSLGMLAIEDALGKSREFIERRSKLEPLAKRAEDEAVLTAIYWYRALETLEGSGGMPALESLSGGLPKERMNALRGAIVWESTRRGVLDLETARDAVTIGETQESFFAAAAGDIAPLECLKFRGDCVLDVYGRRLASLELEPSHVEVLTRVGMARWAPGFNARVEALESPSLLVSMLPYARAPQAIEQKLIAFGVDCDRDVATSLALARELPSASSAAWFLGAGRNAYCDSLAAFIDESSEWLASNRELELSRKPVVSAMVDSRMRGMTNGKKMVAGASYLAKLGAPDSACETWNVALGVAHLRAGRADEANEFTETALSCTKITGAATRLAAFINFDRTRTVSSSFEPDVQRAVKVAARQIVPGDRCIGLLPPSWKWGPIVTPDMEQVVTAIVVPEQAEEEIALATATRTLKTAEKARIDLWNAMKRGDAPAVQAAMAAMESDFAAIGFKPGMKRAAFIRSVLVGKSPESGETATAPGARDARAEVWSDPAAYLDGEETDPKLALAASFLTQTHERWAAQVEKVDDDARTKICGQPAPEPLAKPTPQ